MMNRSAIRFLLDNQSGEFLINDPHTFVTYVRPIQYFPEKNVFQTCFPLGSFHVDLIHAGGVCALHVAASELPCGPLFDRKGQVQSSAILHVQADVEAEIVSDHADVGRILSRLQPENEGECHWVGVSMRLLRQKTRFRDEAMRVGISA